MNDEMITDVKKFLYVFFYFDHVFTFLFTKCFFIEKTLAKFRAASRLTRSTFKIKATK